jgi:hypothetical protein
MVSRGSSEGVEGSKGFLYLIADPYAIQMTHVVEESCMQECGGEKEFCNLGAKRA